MTKLGSFCTEYIRCERCLESARRILVGSDQNLCSIQLPHWSANPTPDQSPTLPIIAGQLGGFKKGEEIGVMRQLIHQLEKRICHEVRVIVLGEDGTSAVIKAVPSPVAKYH
jgi:hypothetical protein